MPYSGEGFIKQWIYYGVDFVDTEFNWTAFKCKWSWVEFISKESIQKS